jgi:hypothetical protein
MKVDIKSFIIGVLTTVNLFLLMAFDDHQVESQHKYDIEYIVVADALISAMWADVKTGEPVGAFNFLEEDENKKYVIYKTQKQMGNKEFFKYLKERD